MDEQRVQAYVALIEQLLNSSNNKQRAVILRQQTQLINAELLVVIDQYIARLKQQGNLQAEEWLRLFAQRLTKVLNDTTRQTNESLKQAVQFLQSVLKLIVEVHGDTQEIYSFMAQHQEQINQTLLQIFPQVTTALLANDLKQQKTLAAVLVTFANRLQQFHLGQRWLNLELSIAAYYRVLAVIRKNIMPNEWVLVMMNLAVAYSDRISGNKVDNIETSINLLNQALTIATRNSMLIEQAEIKLNLANAYLNRTIGGRAENTEQSIMLCEEALAVIVKDAMPLRWGQAKMTLANSYHRIQPGKGKSQNIRKVIKLYKEALTVITKDVVPVEWAFIKNNLAVAYSNQAGCRNRNVEQSIKFYEEALTVLTKDTTPIEWAKIQNNLATSYLDRDKDGDIEKAIEICREALKVLTKDVMPIEWAKIMVSLAACYVACRQGTHANNIEKAITSYEASLQVLNPELSPNDCRGIGHRLGNLYAGQQRWVAAASVYQTSVDAAEQLYRSANLLDSKAAELAETADLLRRAAYAFARTGQLEQAVLTLEQGRARGLSEALDRDWSNLIQLQQSNLALFSQYQDITQQLRNLEAQQRERMTSEERHLVTPEVLRAEAQRLRQLLDQTIAQIRQVEGYADFLAQPDFADIQQAVYSEIPLVYLISTPAGGLALIVTTDETHSVGLDELTDEALSDMLRIWFQAYEAQLTALRNYQDDKSIENRQAYQQTEQTWLKAIDQVTRQLWDLLMAPLIEQLKQHSFQQATLIPTGFLSLLPLHAAWTEDPTTPTGRRYALDEILFTYAPNARSINAAAEIARQTGTDAILAIDNPRNDLPNSSREVGAAVASFPQPQILKHEQATVQSVQNALPYCKILHLSCHGEANLIEPLNSGLALSDGRLTLRDLLNLKLGEQGGIRLAVLSACETGLVGTALPDEAVSLPTGLLQAGVAGVVASLWSVSDLSTMVLLSRFYTLWRDHPLEPCQALTRAQQWLRDAEPNDVIAHCETFMPELKSRTGDLYRALRMDFSHPYHWAAFSYTGV